MSKSQKIVEAEANLQVAKMMEAITRITESTREFNSLYDSDITDMEKVIIRFVELVKSLKEFSKRTCNGQDLKLVTDIIGGIKLRSKYELELKDLNQKLDIGRNAFMQVSDANAKLRGIIADLVVRKSEKKESVDLVRDAKQYKLEDVIERLFVESTKPLACDNEVPF
jgi:hypothetical protein